MGQSRLSLKRRKVRTETSQFNMGWRDVWSTNQFRINSVALLRRQSKRKDGSKSICQVHCSSRSILIILWLQKWKIPDLTLKKKERSKLDFQQIQGVINNGGPKAKNICKAETKLSSVAIISIEMERPFETKSNKEHLYNRVTHISVQKDWPKCLVHKEESRSMHNAVYTWIPLTEQDLWNCTEVMAHRECLDQVNCSSYDECAALCCFVSVCRNKMLIWDI